VPAFSTIIDEVMLVDVVGGEVSNGLGIHGLVPWVGLYRHLGNVKSPGNSMWPKGLGLFWCGNPFKHL
jgi:hypothetical protein